MDSEIEKHIMKGHLIRSLKLLVQDSWALVKRKLMFSYSSHRTRGGGHLLTIQEFFGYSCKFGKENKRLQKKLLLVLVE